MANEPGQAVLTTFDHIIERIKSTRPVRSDNKPLEAGFVYSQLVLGEMIDPADFNDPWSPAGGSTVHDAVKAGAIAPNAGAQVATGAPAAAAPTAVGPTPAPAPQGDGGAAAAKTRRALQAAFNTSQLVDRLIMVTKDEVMREYPGGGRTISFAYEGIINAMQPLPAPPLSPEIQDRLDQAKKILYRFDDDGEIAGKSGLYNTYVKNARAYAEAKVTFAQAQAAALADPAKADSFPMMAAGLQNAVDEAFDTLKTEGAEKIERALGIIESIGVSIQDRMIAKARKVFDAWSLSLAGVPVQTPYAAVSPSSWADPDSDSDGWTRLKVEQSEYRSHAAQNAHFFQQSSEHSDHSATSAQGGGSYFGFGARGGGSTSSTNSSGQGSSGGGGSCTFANDASGLTIDLEYGLCDILRPWLMGDLFYMKNWYMVNNPQKAISDGTIEGQADSDKTLLPMIPMQFLVVRNVKITATHWGSDATLLESRYGQGRHDESGNESSADASVSAGWGPLSLDASVHHEQGRSDHSQSSSSASSGSQDFGAHFDGQTLEIRGAQIVAWLSTIVPPCPVLDDPGLAKAKTDGATKSPAPAGPPAPSPAPAASS